MEQEERIYMLMMDALDGELTPEQHVELEADLQAYPEMMREWQALQAIDTLFKQTPLLTPAADFAQRTIARLPNRRARIGVIGVVYVLLLLSGVLPLLLGIWAVNQLGVILSEPMLVNSLLQTVSEGLTVLGLLLRASVSSVGEFVVQQPAILGWLLVMAGVVVVWGGVYRQLVTQPTQISNGG